MQALREAVLPDFNPAKYEKVFNVSSSGILFIVNDPFLLNSISELCEKMFDIEIKCSFKSRNKIGEPEQLHLGVFLLSTMLDIKDYLGFHAHEESVSLPSGYIDHTLYTFTDHPIDVQSKSP